MVDVDISSWLVNEDSRPGKLKVLVKTHKPGLPVSEVFSVCGQPVENLSALLQFCYLGPIVNSGVLKWRLQDTNDLVRFLHSVNDYLLENKITEEPSICTVDIKNMFPSIFKNLLICIFITNFQSSTISTTFALGTVNKLRGQPYGGGESLKDHVLPH